MSVPSQFSGAAGSWDGTNKLWFEPGSTAIECATTAEVSMVARGNFLAVRYEWSFEGKPQEGLFVVGEDESLDRCDAILLDSFHNGHRMMTLSGEQTLAGDGVLSVRGSYPAPEGPDWGWRVTIEHPDADRFVLRMYNITPDESEALAVEASYARRR